MIILKNINKHNIIQTTVIYRQKFKYDFECVIFGLMH